MEKNLDLLYIMQEINMCIQRLVKSNLTTRDELQSVAIDSEAKPSLAEFVFPFEADCTMLSIL